MRPIIQVHHYWSHDLQCGFYYNRTERGQSPPESPKVYAVDLGKYLILDAISPKEAEDIGELYPVDLFSIPPKIYPHKSRTCEEAKLAAWQKVLDYYRGESHVDPRVE